MRTDSKDRKTFLLGISVLVILTVLAYYPVLWNDFINFDDPSYVTANSEVKEGLTSGSIRWAFTTFYFYNWHPVTWLSHILDVQLFGLNPAGHHAMSLLLHIVNSLLLFALLREMTGATAESLGVAALFALHPLHVEAVAWISGRKDLLSTLFGLLCFFAYVRYTRLHKASACALSLMFFSLSLMAKPMLVTMPLLLFLMDFWPLGRMSDAAGEEKSVSRLLVEKVPFLVLAAASSLIAYYAQQQARELAAGGSLTANISLATANYCRYILKMLWPLKLAVYYPFSPVPVWQAGLSFAFIAAITAAALRHKKRLPWFMFGWLWYLVTLMPVAGFIRIGQHSMADRYTYVPLIGLFVMGIWGIGGLAERYRLDRRAAAAPVLAVVAICAVLTNLYVRKWHDSETLFRHALAVTSNNWVAHKNLGNILAQEGKPEEALLHYTESLRIWPEPLAYVSQGWLFLQSGHYDRAAESAKNSLAMMPENNDKAHFILGAAYVSLHDAQSALAEYETLKDTGSIYAGRLYEVLNSSGFASQVSPP